MNLNECKSLKSISGPTSLGLHPSKEISSHPAFTLVSSSFNYLSITTVV